MSSLDWNDISRNFSLHVNDREIFRCRPAKICAILDHVTMSPTEFDTFFSNLESFHDTTALMDIVSHANVEFTDNLSDNLNIISTLAYIFKFHFMNKLRDSFSKILQRKQVDTLLTVSQGLSRLQNNRNDIDGIKALVESMLKKNEEDENKITQCRKILSISSPAASFTAENNFGEIKTLMESQQTKSDENESETPIESQQGMSDENENEASQSSNTLSISNPAASFTAKSNFEELSKLDKTSENFETIYSIFEKISNANDNESAKLAVENGYHNVTDKYSINTIVSYAAANNNFDLVKLLFAWGVDPSENGEGYLNALHNFCENNNIEAVKYFCEFPFVNRNAQTKGNWSLLHEASNTDYYELCEYLLSKDDVDVNIRDEDGRTPLFYAASESILAFLQYHGAVE